MSRRKDLVIRFEIDLRPFARALKAATDLLFRRFTPAGRLATARDQWGGNGTDARRWPAEWQSAVCSAWLHASCPSPARGLGCSCSCHGAAS